MFVRPGRQQSIYTFCWYIGRVSRCREPVSIVVEKAGLQTTIQSQPRVGTRHLGVPASGPADPLSMALANRLVGNSSFTPALETTLTGATLRFEVASYVAVSGAAARCLLNGTPVALHKTLAVSVGDVLVVGAAESGVRDYIAVAGGFVADDVLGSRSTYMSAKFGGYKGRALLAGDQLRLTDPAASAPLLETPQEFRVPMLEAWSLRAGWSAETQSLADPQKLFTAKLRVGSRCDRMGIKLEGDSFSSTESAQMPSVPVFPGIIQCPQDGTLMIMSVDAGTTGGYPRVAKIARMDLHMLGQLRPGNSIRFIERSNADAGRELREKHAYWKHWITDITDVI
jgi:allophanate hydrolase